MLSHSHNDISMLSHNDKQFNTVLSYSCKNNDVVNKYDKLEHVVYYKYITTMYSNNYFQQP